MNNNELRQIEALLDYYHRSRAVGHTTVMIEGAANVAGTIIISANEHQARYLRERSPDNTVISLGCFDERLRGHPYVPLALDNATIMTILDRLLQEIARKNEQIHDIKTILKK